MPARPPVPPQARHIASAPRHWVRSGRGLARPLLAAALKAGTARRASLAHGHHPVRPRGLPVLACRHRSRRAHAGSVAYACFPDRQAVFLSAAGQDASGGVIREELAAAVAPGCCAPSRSSQRSVRATPRQRGRGPGTVAIRLAPVSRSCTCASTGSPWSAFHGGHRPGRCRQPGEPGFPPACASAAATGCIPGCTPRTGRPGITDRALPAVTSRPPSSLRSSATAWRRRSATTRLSDDGWRGRSLLRRGRYPCAG